MVKILRRRAPRIPIVSLGVPIENADMRMDRSSPVEVEKVFAGYREAVALVAADAVEQVRWMDSTGLSADELRCQIDDIEVLESRLLASRMLSTDAIRAVRILLEYMVSMTEHRLWADDAELSSSPQWAEPRQLAAEALRLIDLAVEHAAVENDAEWLRQVDLER